MVFFNYALRKLNAKIVYYGPGLCGKTTNLQWIHDHFEGGDKGKMVSLATEGDRTIFFDLLPLDIGKIRGMDVTLQLYTVPGQVHYNSTRQLVLRGADGVVFVADSQRAMQGSNADSLRNLEENLRLQGVNFSEFPHVIQFNKRDLGDLMPVEEMDGALNEHAAPFFEAVAVEGIGVQETLEGIVRLVMRSLKDRYEARGMGTQVERLTGKPAPTPAPAAPSGIRPMAAADRFPPITPASGNETIQLPAPVQGGGESLFEEPSESHGGLDQPSPDLGPPHGAAGEPVEDADQVPLEEVDTHTGMLVPPVAGADDLEELPPMAADHPPEGPGLPVEPEADDVSVAEYDTADWESGNLEPEEAPAQSEPEALPEADTFTHLEPIEAAEPQAFAPPEEPVEFTEPEPVDDGPAPEPLAPPRPAPDVNDLVASVLGSRPPAPPAPAPDATDEPSVFEPVETAAEEPAFEAEETVFEPPPEPAEEPDQWEAVDHDEAPAPAAEPFEPPSPDPTEAETPTALEPPEPGPSGRVARMPVVLGEGDPFGDVAPVEAVLERDVGEGPEASIPVSVEAEPNSLALKLTGTGAIVESGQVRALDIEVPVPGHWVGHRRVTLQLRLTLSPTSEDENGGSGDPA